MIKLNLQRLLQNKGIEHPQNFLRSNGFSIHTTHCLLNNVNTSISYRNMEKLCILFNCEPSDLFEWVAQVNSDIPGKHPLHKLKRVPNENITHKIKHLPLDKLDELRQYIDRLSENDKAS